MFLAVPAVVAVSCGGNPAQAYLENAQNAESAGQWGAAMAAYDAAHDEAPNDAVLTQRRTNAAAHWLAQAAPDAASQTPPAKAAALLWQLAEEGNKRGAQQGVAEHVVGPLDRAVAAIWPGEVASDNPKALWQSLRTGERLTRYLPANSASRQKWLALKQTAVALFAQQRAAAKHAASGYFYDALAARLDHKPPSDAARQALQAETEFNFALEFDRPAKCPQFAPAFRATLDTMGHYFSPRPAGGLPVSVSVQVDCDPLRPPTQRVESRKWMQTTYQPSSVTSCSDNTVLKRAGETKQSVQYLSRNSALVTTTTIKPEYATVKSCSTSFSLDKHVEDKSDEVTVTAQEVGYRLSGHGGIGVAGVEYQMPISVRAISEKITTEGKIFGHKEEMTLDPTNLLAMAAHDVWLEMAYLNDQAHESYAGVLVREAATADADAKLAKMVAALRIHRRITSDYTQWFAEATGLDTQDLSEIVLEAPHVEVGVQELGGYKLALPKIDATVRARVEQKKVESGVDEFK